jgi:hypothetical protein
MRLRKKVSRFVWFVLIGFTVVFLAGVIHDITKRSSEKNEKLLSDSKKTQDNIPNLSLRNIDREAQADTGVFIDTLVTKFKVMFGMIEIPDTKNPIRGICKILPDATASDVIEILNSWNPWRDPVTKLLEYKIPIHQDINIPYDKNLIKSLLQEFPDLYKDEKSVKSLLLSYNMGSERDLIDYDEKMNIIWKLSETMREDFIKNDTDPDIKYMMCDHYYKTRNEVILVKYFPEDLIARVSGRYPNMKIFKEKIVLELERVKGKGSSDTFQKKLTSINKK